VCKKSNNHKRRNDNIMNLLIALKVAFKALRRNKVRTLLTMLGIIIGIAAVISVIAVGEGATVMVQNQIREMGDNLLTVRPGSSRSRGVRHGAGTQHTLTVKDGDAILEECHYVKNISPLIWSSGQIVYKNKNWRASIRGIAPSYLEISNWQLTAGTVFIESDIRSATKKCIIGATVAKELFPTEDPIGKIIRIKKVPFRILGVLKEKGSAVWGSDQDDVVMMPWTTVQRVIQSSSFNNINMLVMSLTSLNILEQAHQDISAILRQRHNLSENADDDFSIRDMTELTERFTQTSELMTILLSVIASISLIVGGIGIMNIMLVSVTERTREIGLRMAVGAKGKDILMQFLVEAIVLSGIGGVLGILLGSGVAEAISRINQWPVLVSIESILLAVIFSATIGIFFGFYPAWRASRLNPIDALRYE